MFKHLWTVLVLLALFLGLVATQTEYQVSQVVNDTCFIITQFPSCSECNGYYYQFYEYTGNSNDEIYVYSNPQCTYLSGITAPNFEQCDIDFGDCQIFYNLIGEKGYKLILSSTSNIFVEYLGENYIGTTLSQRQITAEGNLKGLTITNTIYDYVFRFENQISSTQYTSTLGIFNFGNTYSLDAFTFSVTPITINFPVNVQSQHVVYLQPAFSAWVTNSEQYTIGFERNGGLYIATDSLTLDGLVVTNPLFTMTNMTVLEPYLTADEGLIFFQFPSSPFFHTYPCYYTETEYTYDEYFCDIASLSDLPPSILFPSLPQPNDPHRNVDEMSFSLF